MLLGGSASALPVEDSTYPIRRKLSPNTETAVRRLETQGGSAVAEFRALDSATLSLSVVLRSASGVDELRRAGFGVRAHVGRVASLDVPAQDLGLLLAEGSLVRAALRRPYRMLLDVNGLENGAVEARSRGASGAGTLIAVIDSGIDFRHPDFLDAGGRTRIKYIWDQFDPSYEQSGGSVGSPPPAGGAGTVYTEEQINAALAGSGVVNSVDLAGHGTLVASAAAGSGRPGGVYVGTAPEASLLVVRMGGITKSDLSLPGDLISALAWIDERADELDMPVVVNMSFGDHIASHDGTNPEELAIDEFVSRPGRTVVVAAGNEGGTDIHASGSSHGSVTIDLFQSGLSDVIIVDCWLPGGDRVDLGFLDPRGQGNPNMNIATGFCGTVTGLPNRVSACVGDVDPLNDAREVFFFVEPVTSLAPISAGTWRFTLRDEGAVQDGRFDCWSPNGQPFTSQVDPTMLVGSPGTARGAITVGAFSARNRWPSQTGESSNGAQVGALAFFSSPGPSRDGRRKPELTAGGYSVVGAWSSADGTGSGIAGVPARPNLVTPDSMHVASNGSSFAAPQVAGAVALMLERDAALAADEIRALLIEEARADGFTGGVPNDFWGHGKLDVGAAVLAVPERSTATPTATSTPTRTPTATSTATATPTPVVSFPGDANCDSQLSEADRLATLLALFDPGARCSGDCNRDGVTNAADLNCVAQRMAE